VVEIQATALLNTEVEVNYYRSGGILHTALRVVFFWHQAQVLRATRTAGGKFYSGVDM
jgi:hypothetical protein